MGTKMNIKDCISFGCLFPAKKIVNKISGIVNRCEGRVLRKGDSDNLLQKVSPVFVLSSGRSGTMTLTALMRLSPFIDAYHEPEPRLPDIAISYLAFINKRKEISSVFWDDFFRRTRDAVIFKDYYNDKVYFESNNRMTLLASFFNGHYPLCRFVHLCRHPYGFIHSAMRRGYYQSHSGDFARVHPTIDDAYYNEWKDMGRLEKCAWLWDKVNGHVLKVLKEFPEERKLFTRSEDLFNGNKPAITNLYKFIVNAPLPPQKKIENVLGKKLNQQVAGKYPKIEEWSDLQISSINKIVGNTMGLSGYEY